MHRRQFLAAASVAALPRAALAVPNRDADLRAALDGLAKLDTPAARRARLKGFDPASLSPSARIDLETVRAGLAVDAELLRSLPVGRLGRSPYVIAPNAGAWREKAPDAQRIEAENAQIAADARHGVLLPAPLLERTRSGIIAAAGKATGPAAAALAGQARLLADLAPRAPKEPGTSRFPGGARYFALLLERHYGAAIAPAEAHRQMLAVAEALTARADAVLKRLGHAQGTVGARISAAFKDRRFLYSDDDAGRNRAVADMNATLAATRPHLPALFGPLPPECLNVSALRMPPQEEAEGKQGYRTIPAPGIAGAYFPDLARIRDRPSWTLPAVVHHELLPGHMIQLPIEAASEPHPLRIEYAPAFAEGWAIYAEQLMAARGAFAGDDHALLGHLHWLLFRIGRGLVDTGVHIGQETLAQTSSKLATLQGEAAYFAPMAQDIERICIEPAMRAAEALTWLGLTRLGSTAQRNGPESLRKFHRRLLADGRRRFAMIAQRRARAGQEATESWRKPAEMPGEPRRRCGPGNTDHGRIGMRKGILRRNLWCAGVSLAVIAGAGIATPALAQDMPAAPADTGVQEQDQTSDGAIVVTGFRQSLDKALNVKRASVSSVDAVVAEDIAKFPDQNLAESLQRIPGISIQRDAGEGRAITVRGLGAQFTRVRVNGLETVATSTDGASANRDRAFDFNVFASELFSSLVVHKTAEASLDEGSLGAVVDLNTGNPLAGKAGFTFVGSVQGSYNDLSKNWGPRVAGLVSWKSPSGTFGVAVSGAYSKTDNLELGNNSVRWAQATFDQVDGTNCWTTANSGGTYVPSAVCSKAALAFHPRIPRYGSVRHDRERLGLTGSVQWAPSDATKISIDGLYSRFKETREEKWLEVLLRSNERSINVVNPVYDGNNNMISATLNDAWVRTEHYLRKSDTEFYQIGGTWDQQLGDSFRFTLLGGLSKSNADIPVETTIVLDDRDAQNYRYDYTNMRSPVLSFGTSVTDPANFQLAEIRDRPSNVTNKFRTAQLRTEWDVAEGFQIKSGAMYRRFDYDVKAFQRDTAVCGNGGLDLVLKTITCSPTSAFGPTAVYGFQATPALTELVNLGKAGQPAGTTTSWVIANIDAAAAYTGLYNRPLLLDVGNNRSVTEEVKGGYLQFDAKGELLGLRYALNAGMRYASTRQSSTGINGTLPVTFERTYDDWLPSMNIALFPTDKIILRGAIADVMTRPTLGSLTPGGSADGFNYRVSFGNPNLDPYRATAYDLAAEWYFAPQSIFSVAVFKKDVKSFPVSATLTGQTFTSTGLPASVLSASSPAFLNPAQQAQPIWTVVTTVNGTGASLKGIEIAVQAPFRFLPGFLKNFGGIANATFIDSTATYSQSAPATAVNANGSLTLPNRPFTSTLYGVSKKAFNATLYYEDKKFSARASVSYRGPYVDAGSGTGNVFEGYNAITNVDASVRYKLTDWIELSVEGTNLTDAYRDRYTDTAANRNYEYNHFGRTILFGARLKL